MKLSVIVCVYNTEKEGFDRCLHSVYTSTLKDFEVIVIDDGSTIDYSEIIEKYHPVYVKTDNRGQLAARTYGLMIAKGEYVAYLDSDDTVTFNYYQPMVKTADKEKADIVINDWAFKMGKISTVCKRDTTISGDLSLENDEILRQFAKHQGRQHSYYVLWNKIFKKSLLLTAKAEIEKTDAIMNKMTYSEDVLISFFAFKHAKRLKNIHTGYYLYHIHGGQSIEMSDGEKIKSQARLIGLNFEIMMASIGQNKYAEEIKKNILEWRGLMSRTHYSYAKATGDEELFTYIRNVYKTDKLSRSTLKDSRDYITSGLLGENFEGIDAILRFIYKKGKDVSVKYDKGDEYVAKSLKAIEGYLGIKIIESDEAQIVIPKRKNSLSRRVLHNKLAVSVAMVIFPKGSRIREALKRKL